jgi:hypothetical protein
MANTIQRIGKHRHLQKTHFVQKKLRLLFIKKSLRTQEALWSIVLKNVSQWLNTRGNVITYLQG